jgi:hypothetical protein
MAVVYRDGKSCFSLFMADPLNLGIGVVYYLYLFGRSCAATGWANRLLFSPVLSCINLTVVKALPVSRGALFDFFQTSSVVSNIGLPATLRTALCTVSGTFVTSSRYSRDSLG